MRLGTRLLAWCSAAWHHAKRCLARRGHANRPLWLGTESRFRALIPVCRRARGVDREKRAPMNHPWRLALRFHSFDLEFRKGYVAVAHSITAKIGVGRDFAASCGDLLGRSRVGGCLLHHPTAHHSWSHPAGPRPHHRATILTHQILAVLQHVGSTFRDRFV